MTPLQRYQSDLTRSGFLADREQRRGVELLETLYRALQAPLPKQSLWNNLFGGSPAVIRGVYLWGDPGRGKTYLMDCFFDSLPIREKYRVHFHRFMLGVHQALDGLSATADPLKIVAGQLALRYRVLCLDEFHVTDVADAMLLAVLLEALVAQGVVLVATSNMAPDDLYLDGLQRRRLVPAIELLKQHTQVCDLNGGEDFRLRHARHAGTYQLVEGDAAEQWLGARLLALTAVKPVERTTLLIAGRNLQVRAVAERVAWFEFAELCQQPRSARDYLELAYQFHTLLLQGVPHLSEEMDEAVRRFIHLIDALYDQGVKLIVTAAAEPGELYIGTRLQTAFQRTASRLAEMSGEAYLTRVHRPD